MRASNTRTRFRARQDRFWQAPQAGPNPPEAADVEEPLADEVPRMARLILLEDNDFVRHSQERLFVEWGARLLASGSNVDEVIALAAGCDEAPDIIISDFDLGSQTGVHAIERLREMYNFCVPAVVVTARYEDAAPGTLVGKIGGSCAGRTEDGKTFVVGSVCVVSLDATTRGPLYLAMNIDPPRPTTASK